MLSKILLVPLNWLVLRFDSGGSGNSTTTATTMNYSPEEAARRTAVMDEALRIYNRGKPITATVPTGTSAGSATPSPFTNLEAGNQTSTASTTPATVYTLDPGETPAYPGQTPIGPSAATNWATNYLGNLAQTYDPSQVNNALRFGLTGALDVNNNQYLQQAIQSAIDPITTAYNGAGGALSQIRTGAEQVGQFGGSRQGIAEGMATDKYLRQVGNTSAQMSSDAYNKGLDTFTRSLALAPDITNMSLLPASWMGAVGASQEGYDANQAAYDAASREWQLNYPWLNLQNLANVVYGSGSMGGTTSSTGPGYSTNPLMTGLGALSMGAGLYNNMAPWFSSGAGSTAATGATALGAGSAVASGMTAADVLAGVSAALSDRRLKRDIRRIGSTARGTPLYEFEYLGIPRKCVGVMADEAPKEAVVDIGGGILAVNYAKV